MAHHSGNSLVGSSSLFPWTAAGLLELLASGLEGCPNLELEFSLRLGGGNLQSAGRFACWVNGKSAEDFAPLRRVLDCMALRHLCSRPSRITSLPYGRPLPSPLI